MKKNWKTTLVGCIGAVVNVALPLVQTGTVKMETVIISIILAALGFFAKDFNVTGGVGQ